MTEEILAVGPFVEELEAETPAEGEEVKVDTSAEGEDTKAAKPKATKKGAKK